MEEKPNYYAIIPANVRYDDDLIPNAKLLYGEITALCSKEGYCYATNNYFAKLYKVHNYTVSNWVQMLKSKGYISIEIIYKGNTKQVDKRIIKIIDTYKQNVGEGINKKIDRGINEKVEENNTSINNTRINNKEIYKEIINYLNEVTGKRYRHTDVTIKLIKARLNEGFTVDDFKQVIDKKTKDWKDDPKMKDYIRPQTLFGTKFEGYLNQEEKKKPGFMGYMEEFYGKENDS